MFSTFEIMNKFLETVNYIRLRHKNNFWLTVRVVDLTCYERLRRLGVLTLEYSREKADMVFIFKCMKQWQVWPLRRLVCSYRPTTSGVGSADFNSATSLFRHRSSCLGIVRTPADCQFMCITQPFSTLGKRTFSEFDL